jgi:excisionase family DNA binding protein
MKPQVFSMIELAVNSDDSLTPWERQAILEFCRHPIQSQQSDDGGGLELLKAQDVAAILHIHIRTVRRYIRAGKLKSTRIQGVRRVKMADLKSFLSAEPKVSPDLGQPFTVKMLDRAS